jgi:hypothetical protein
MTQRPALDPTPDPFKAEPDPDTNYPPVPDIQKRIKMWAEERTKIPEGTYSLKCVKAEKTGVWHQGGKAWAESKKIILWFEVFEGPYARQMVPAFLPLNNKKITQGQKYFQFWCIANGLRRPARNRLKEMPLSKFEGKLFSGEVVDVRPKYTNGRALPELFSYSRVDALYELIAGNPDA